MAVAHHCHANDCPTKTPRKYLMCPRHWRMVPRRLQMAVWHEYFAAGGLDGPISDLTHAGYWKAAAEAVEAVAVTEGKPLHNSYRLTWLALLQARLGTETDETSVADIVRLLQHYDRLAEARKHPLPPATQAHAQPGHTSWSSTIPCDPTA